MSASFVPDSSLRRVPLSKIDSAVSARLGATRGLGNSQPACFNRQVAMYLAKHIGRWSTSVIGRFYDGRDHSTVCHGIQRVETLRGSNPDLDSLLSNLKSELLHGDVVSERKATSPQISVLGLKYEDFEQLADLIADRVYARLTKNLPTLVRPASLFSWQNPLVFDRRHGAGVVNANSDNATSDLKSA